MPAGACEVAPHFSIVIPAFNEELYLDECLASLAAQNYSGSVEVIVVDNGSTDATAAVAVAGGAIVVVEPTPGVCRARHTGTMIARGAIIVSADADTIYHPAWLSCIDGWMTDHPAHVAVGGPCYFHDGPAWGRAIQRMLFGAVAGLDRMTGRVLYVTATNFAFYRWAWPGYDVRLSQGGDELDLLRRMKKGGPVGFDPTNPVRTSARRMHAGLIYNLFVSFLYYYILGYALSRILGWPVLGAYPAFRHAKADATGRPIRMQIRPGDDTMARTVRFVAIAGGVAAFWVYRLMFSPRSQALMPFPFRARTERKLIALTFDDGPNEPYTSQLADLLACNSVKPRSSRSAGACNGIRRSPAGCWPTGI